jgi:hypothetical protein
LKIEFLYLTPDSGYKANDFFDWYKNH